MKLLEWGLTIFYRDFGTLKLIETNGRALSHLDQTRLQPVIHFFSFL
jgi:hypothetical protein